MAAVSLCVCDLLSLSSIVSDSVPPVLSAASNEFFLQFPNCLAFKDIDDCVNKLQYALANTPESVTDKYRHMLSWEGATDRLFETSAITVVEALEREASGNNAADRKAAKFHTDSAKRSQFVSSLFSGKILPSRS